jgi:hypothetical protein
MILETPSACIVSLSSFQAELLLERALLFDDTAIPFEPFLLIAGFITLSFIRLTLWYAN